MADAEEAAREAERAGSRPSPCAASAVTVTQQPKQSSGAFCAIVLLFVVSGSPTM
jgi:hypothetical protein